MRQLTVILTAALTIIMYGLSDAHSEDNVLQKMGKDIKEAGKELGKAGREVGKTIGKTGKNVGKGVAKSAKDIGRAVRGD